MTGDDSDRVPDHIPEQLLAELQVGALKTVSAGRRRRRLQLRLDRDGTTRWLLAALWVIAATAIVAWLAEFGPPGPMFVIAALAVVASIVATSWVAWRRGRVMMASLSREESRSEPAGP